MNIGGGGQNFEVVAKRNQQDKPSWKSGSYSTTPAVPFRRYNTFGQYRKNLSQVTIDVQAESLRLYNLLLF